MERVIIGIDIGGTKIAIRFEDGQKKEIAATVIATNRSSGTSLYEALLAAIEQLMQQHRIQREHIVGIGIGMPGIINIEQGFAIMQNNVPLENFPIKELLQQQFPNATIEIENDVNVAAIHEYALRHFSTETMLYITVSTGIASSIIYKGDIFQQRGRAGEVGFWTRGFEKTLEQDLSGPAIEKQLQQQLKTDANLQEILGQQQVEVQQETEKYMEQLASALFEMIVFINPHCVVIGGGLMNGQLQLFEQLVEKTQQKITATGIFDQQLIRIEQAIHKGDSGVNGAILLVK